MIKSTVSKRPRSRKKKLQAGERAVGDAAGHNKNEKQCLSAWSALSAHIYAAHGRRPSFLLSLIRAEASEKTRIKVRHLTTTSENRPNSEILIFKRQSRERTKECRQKSRKAPGSPWDSEFYGGGLKTQQVFDSFEYTSREPAFERTTPGPQAQGHQAAVDFSHPRRRLPTPKVPCRGGPKRRLPTPEVPCRRSPRRCLSEPKAPCQSKPRQLTYHRIREKPRSLTTRPLRLAVDGEGDGPCGP